MKILTTKEFKALMYMVLAGEKDGSYDLNILKLAKQALTKIAKASK